MSRKKKEDASFWLNEFYLLVKSKPLHKCFYISSVNAAISTELSELSKPVIMCFNFTFHFITTGYISVLIENKCCFFNVKRQLKRENNHFQIIKRLRLHENGGKM